MCDDHRSRPSASDETVHTADETAGSTDPRRRWDRRALLTGAGAATLVALAPRSAVARSPQRAVRVAPGLSIRPRAAWGARLPVRGAVPVESDVRLLVVHHSASPNHWSAIRTMQVTYWTHTAEKGWPDVCYQFFVANDGTVYEGRRGSLRTTTLADATGGSQGFSQLVCLLGDFTSTRPTPAAYSSLVRTLAFLAERSDVDTSRGATTRFTSRGSQRWPQGSRVTSPTIAPHSAMSYTSCPGNALAPLVGPSLMRDVDRQRRRWRREGWQVERPRA